MANRILATHAGSLPKTRELSRLYAARAAGKADGEDEFSAKVEAVETAVIAEQIESGVDILNDGEVGREGFFSYVRHRMTVSAGNRRGRLAKLRSLRDGAALASKRLFA